MNLFGYGLWCPTHRSFDCSDGGYRQGPDGTVTRPPRCPYVKWGPFRYKTNPDNSPARDALGRLVPEEGQGLELP